MENLLLDYEQLTNQTDELRFQVETFADNINDYQDRDDVSQKDKDSYLEQYWLLYDAVSMLFQVAAEINKAKNKMRKSLFGKEGK